MILAAVAIASPTGASGGDGLPTTGQAILKSMRLPTPAHTEVGSATINHARYAIRVAATPTRSLVRIRLSTRCHKGGDVRGPYLRRIQIYFFALNLDTFVKVVGNAAIDRARVTRSVENGLRSACISGTVASGPFRACVAANHFGLLNYATVATHLTAFRRGVTSKDFQLPALVR